MTRRPGHEVEAEPHYVYIHLNAHLMPIYVGRTIHPETRPHNASRRPWIKTESVEVDVSPPMSRAAATWTEAELIRALSPKHNKRPGESHEPPPDPRVNRLAEIAGCTRADARRSIYSWPRNPDEFEAALRETFPDKFAKSA